jgi:hypothetical protein
LEKLLFEENELMNKVNELALNGRRRIPAMNNDYKVGDWEAVDGTPVGVAPVMDAAGDVVGWAIGEGKVYGVYPGREQAARAALEAATKLELVRRVRALEGDFITLPLEDL